MLYLELVEYLFSGGFLGGREFPHLYHLPDDRLHLVVYTLPSTGRSSFLSHVFVVPLLIERVVRWLFLSLLFMTNLL